MMHKQVLGCLLRELRVERLHQYGKKYKWRDDGNMAVEMSKVLTKRNRRTERQGKREFTKNTLLARSDTI